MSTIRSELHAAARNYAAQGIPIFPCISDAAGRSLPPGERKRPVVEGAYAAASKDLAQIDRWWNEDPNYNIALCPEDMGWAVVDIDPDADLTGLELPETRTNKTPRGGKHLIYVGTVPPTVGKLAKHVDTRGQRSYILVPPSVVNGGRYEEVDGRYPALLPASIEAGIAARNDTVGARTEELDSPTDINSARALLHAYARRGTVSIQGQGGNNKAYEVAAKLVRDYGLSGRTAHSLMMGEWNDACVPPWSGPELAEIVTHAMSYGQNAAASFATRPAADTFAHVDLAKFKSAEPEPDGDHPTESRFRFLSGPEMTALEPPTWILPGVIPEDGIVLVTAAKGSFKTFLAMELALSIPLGRQTWGSEPLCKGLTFYGAHEGIRAIQKKHRDAWCIENGVDPLIDTGFYVAPGPHISNGEACKEFADQIEIVAKREKKQPRLLILDTYSQCMLGLNENDPGDVSKFLSFCQSFIRRYPGASVLTLAHLGKDVTRGTRGSNALEAGVDTVIDLTREDRTLLAKAKVRFQRSAEEKPGSILFRGKIVQDSLVFTNIHPAEYLAEKALVDPADKRHVAGILQNMGATDEGHGVTAGVLADTMTVRRMGESAADLKTRVRDMERLLQNRHELTVLHQKIKGQELWFAPAPPDDPDPDGL